MPEGGLYFCYLSIRLPNQFWVACGLLALGFILGVRTAMQYRIARRVSDSKYVKIIYLLLITWNIFYLSKLLYGGAIFLSQKDKTDDYELSIMSKYYFVIDILSVFFLQWLLIFIPYNWFRNVLAIYNQLVDMEDSELIQQQVKFERVCYKALKIYMGFRLLYLFLFVPFGWDVYATFQATLVKWMLGLLLLEALVVILILGLGIRALKKNERLTHLIDQSQVATMINQYSILIVCTIIRFSVDILITILNSDKFSESPSCKLNQVASPPQNMVLLILESIITHYLPIFIVQRIYKVDVKKIDLTSSLLDAAALHIDSQPSSEFDPYDKQK